TQARHPDYTDYCRLTTTCAQKLHCSSQLQFSQRDSLNLQTLQTQLTHSGYQRVSQVRLPGEFAVRGAIVDIFPLNSPQALRIELDDEKIDSLRYLDPDTQQTGTACTHI